jgi:hypothetical protein
MSPIIFSANSVLKMQVFWAWSSLRMSACTVPRTCVQHVGADLGVLGRVDELSPETPSSPSPDAVVSGGQLAAVAGAAGRRGAR